MKTITYFLLIFIITISACKVKKVNNSIENEKYNIRVECIPHRVQSSTFSGKVVDLSTQEELPFARIVLRSKNTSWNYARSVDHEGKFSIENVPPGLYSLEVEYKGDKIAYSNLEIKNYSNCIAEIKVYRKPIMVEKPVIYLYPTHKQTINVRINYKGIVTHTYPKYPKEGWHVTAEPDGTLWDESNKEFYALFWEGKPNKQLIAKEGFVVPGEKTAEFLEEKLAFLGLNRREANEFIMYWLPRMEHNPYNLIHFSGNEYDEMAELVVTPKPETIIRVMMLTQPLATRIDFPLQDLTMLRKSRKGFTVVEWGGSELNTRNDTF
jgi:hypothetical protein